MIKLLAASVALLLAASASYAAAAPQAAAAPDIPSRSTKFSVIQTKVQMQSGSAVFANWPSGGRTWHHGEGFIEPFGLAQYWCGEGFPEQSTLPEPDYLKGFSSSFIGNPAGDLLFCIYRTDAGDLYAYDSPVGTLHAYDAPNNPRMEQTVNFVVGGTGMYKGATGVWMGVVEGRGKVMKPIPGALAEVPEVLLKIMDGYVKLPK